MLLDKNGVTFLYEVASLLDAGTVNKAVDPDFHFKRNPNPFLQLIKILRYAVMVDKPVTCAL